MPKTTNGNPVEKPALSKKIAGLTGIVIALTALITALVHFRDSIPWLTPVATIEVSPNPMTLAIDDKIQIAATVRDANKNLLSKRVTWSSANPRVLEIDADGIMTGKVSGDTTVKASIGSISAVANVKVRRINVAKVDVFPPVTTLLVDDRLKLDATPYDSDGNSLLGRTIRWSSEIPQIAAVDTNSGETTGKMEGMVTILAQSEEAHATATLNVHSRPTTSAANTPAVAPPSPVAPSAAPAGRRGVDVTAGHRAGAAVPIPKTEVHPPHNPAIEMVHPQVPVVVLSPALKAAVAVANKITITKGSQIGACPARIRIIVGDTLVNIQSDPQSVDHIPLGDQPYSLHGIVSCANQTPVAVNGHGTIGVANGRTYRCHWLQKGPKDFEISLEME
jgi:Bacterial Ig-like domain (group 2)